MIVRIPARIGAYCERFSGFMSESKREALAALLSGYLLVSGKRTQAGIGREVLTAFRDPSLISRKFRRESFRTRDLVRREMQNQIAQERRRAMGQAETWFLILDGLCAKRGSETMVENATQYRIRKSRQRRRSTKAHTFVQGILVTPSGRRIPLPRRSYYTKEYVRRENRRLQLGRRKGKPVIYKTQVELACLIIKEIQLPDTIRLVVLADQYFEGTKVTALCRKKNYIFIAPVNSNRNFASQKKIYRRGKALPRSAYQELILRRGEEDTASHRRYHSRRAGEKDERIYRFNYERRAVARTGEAGIVYSWKRKRDRSGRLAKGETFKVLVCSDPTLTGAEIIEFFEMRWAIEVFFRELKSHLGLEDYQGTDFRACERHYDLILLSFMLLEQMRHDLMMKTRSPVRRRQLAGMRTPTVIMHLRAEAQAEDMQWIQELVGSQMADSRVMARLLPKACRVAA